MRDVIEIETERLNLRAMRRNDSALADSRERSKKAPAKRTDRRFFIWSPIPWCRPGSLAQRTLARPGSPAR